MDSLNWKKHTSMGVKRKVWSQFRKRDRSMLQKGICALNLDVSETMAPKYLFGCEESTTMQYSRCSPTISDTFWDAFFTSARLRNTRRSSVRKLCSIISLWSLTVSELPKDLPLVSISFLPHKRNPASSLSIMLRTAGCKDTTPTSFLPSRRSLWWKAWKAFSCEGWGSILFQLLQQVPNSGRKHLWNSADFWTGKQTKGCCSDDWQKKTLLEFSKNKRICGPFGSVTLSQGQIYPVSDPKMWRLQQWHLNLLQDHFTLGNGNNRTTVCWDASPNTKSLKLHSFSQQPQLLNPQRKKRASTWIFSPGLRMVDKPHIWWKVDDPFFLWKWVLWDSLSWLEPQPPNILLNCCPIFLIFANGKRWKIMADWQVTNPMIPGRMRSPVQLYGKFPPPWPWRTWILLRTMKHLIRFTWISVFYQVLQSISNFNHSATSTKSQKRKFQKTRSYTTLQNLLLALRLCCSTPIKSGIAYGSVPASSGTSACCLKHFPFATCFPMCESHDTLPHVLESNATVEKVEVWVQPYAANDLAKRYVDPEKHH